MAISEFEIKGWEKAIENREAGNWNYLITHWASHLNRSGFSIFFYAHKSVGYRIFTRIKCLALANYPIEGRPLSPLAAYKKESRVKIFLFDVGLLNHMLGSRYR